MRCGYCHNPQIVKGKGHGTATEVLEFLEKRKGLLDGVVLSGGEASIYPGLSEFVRQIRVLGYSIKLDTNGLRPDLVQDFINRGFLDYIALDYKAPPEKFKKVTGISKFCDFSKTLSLLCRQKEVPFEIRTTVHTALMDEEDILSIMRDLDSHAYTGTYYVQNFRADNNRPTLGRLLPQKHQLKCNSIPHGKAFQVEFRNFN